MMNYKCMVLGVMGRVGVLEREGGEGWRGMRLRGKERRGIVGGRIEWGGSELKSWYVVVGGGYRVEWYVGGGEDGMKFRGKYGYVGVGVEEKELVREGLKEEGVCGGVLYLGN